MRNYLACLLFILTVGTTCAQQFVVLSGQITDAQTQLPLEYANIVIRGKFVGTVSNTQGGFEFHFSGSHTIDTLAISHIGYTTQLFPITSLLGDGDLHVRLKPSTYLLPEIVVHNGTYTVHSLLQDVVAAYDSNYATKPYEMEAFYRETRKEGDKYGYLLEAAVTMQRPTYQKPYVTSLTEVRINQYSKEFDYKTNENFLESLLMNDYIAEPHSGFFRHYSRKGNYIIEDTTMYDGHPVYIVSKGSLPGWKETYYIDATDLAIIRFDGETYYGADSSLVMGKPSKNKVLRYRYLKVVNIYKKMGATYFLNYMRMQLDHDIYDKLKKKTDIYKIFNRETMVNQIGAAKGSQTKTAMKHLNLEDQLKKYNPDFWKNYNTLKRTPLEEKIAKDLERESKLEDQFRKQNEVVNQEKKKSNGKH